MGKMWRVAVIVCVFAFGTFIPGIIGSRKARDVGSLLQNYPYNRYLFSQAPKPFYVVTPKQMRKKYPEPISTREHKISHHGIYEHYQQVTFQIVMDKKKYKLKLERNDGLLSAGIRVKHFEEEQREVISKTVEHCYYHGTIKKDEWSAVAVSTCNGIRGTLHVNNETYIIQPLQGGNKGTEYPHLVYKATTSGEEKCGNDLGKWLPFNELHRGEFMGKQKFLDAKKTMGGFKDDTKDKFLKLGLVLDHSMYWYLNFTIRHMLEYAIQTANIVDLYYKELNIRMALTYVEMWNRGNRIKVSPKLRETLENFIRYKQKFLAGADHHAAHLLTRMNFEQDAVGMSIPDSICTNRAGGINKNPSHLEPQKGATILAHMVGHNLGIKHDEDKEWRYLYHQGGCECSDEFGCIMSTEVLATPEKYSRMFSSCSSKDWNTSLNMGIAACLTESPQPTFPQTCGNKLLERGEECDCGTPEDCARTDPCCDPYTCLLKSWADCRTGACCYNCTYISSDYVCRPQSTDCDVPEFCTGNDGQCPPNNYAQDGHSCNNDTGYCMGGICPTLDKQCQFIWGKEGSKADTQCYEKFNPTGNFNGHCGKNPSTGWYAECLPEDIQCGLLHCSGGTKEPLYGPDKDSSKTTFTTNGQEFECKTVYGPSTLQLPNLGLVSDGTKCGDGHVCMKQKCVPLSNLPSLNCPGTTTDTVCSGHGICTKDDSCFCDDGWGSPACDMELNTTRTILSLNSLIRVTTTTTTTEKVKVIPIEVTQSTLLTSTTELSSAAVVQASESGLLNTKWMMIILASVIGGLALVLGFSFLCYRRRTPGKFKKDKKKKKYAGHCEEGEIESSNKLIKFGSLPSYKDEKKKNKTKNKKGKKGRKGGKTDDDSDIELPPPPTIISDPNSAKPEKGILKSTFGSSKYMNMGVNERRSSESNSNTATSASDRCDLDSVGPYDEIDDDTEAGEIQDIFSGNSDEPERTLDVLDNMIESSSFDFMLPPPFSNMGLLNRSPSPPKMFSGYDIPLTNLNHTPPQRPNLWKPSMMSPPKSRVLRMRNLNELLTNIDRNTIDLSPSPDDPPVQISPSTSEDVRSSSTEDRPYPASSHDPQSPNSTTSGSTCTALRPLLGSQWSKYILNRNNPDNDGHMELEDMDSPLPHINIPPPMNPLNIRSIFNYGQKGMGRDNNDTPLGSQNGECSSNNGTANSRNGYEKSSGYGSEHDNERFSIEDISRNQSRSGSASPPNFSAVIRTGPNQIKLVPAGKFQSQPGYGGYSYNPMDNDLHKLLEGVPRIDAGSYERCPINRDTPQSQSSTVHSEVGSLDTLKNSILDSSLNSDTNTLVNSDYETMDRMNMENRKNELANGAIYSTDPAVITPMEQGKNQMPELSDGPLPNPKPLSELDKENSVSGPCIDRSLEEISQLDGLKKKKHSLTNGINRPVSMDVRKSNDSSDGSHEWDPLMVNRYSAIDPIPVDICDC